MSSTITLAQTYVFAILLIACCAHQAMSRSLLSNESNSVHTKFEQWMAKHNCTYRNDDAIKEKRFKIFKQNLEYITEFNAAGKQTYQLGLNAFSDLTREEFLASNTGLKLPVASLQESSNTFRYEEVSEVPASMDWRANGAVTPVKQQGGCASCWAFSAVAAIESITQIKTGRLVALSEQQLVDCSTKSGCNGHWMNDAFKYVIQNNGIRAETDYRPYSATAKTCSASVASLPAAQITSYEDVPSNNEAALLKAAAMQPVSTCIDGSGRDFQNYMGGIFAATNCGIATSHAVAIVGYGTSEEGTKYWLVKNSWGTSWGENGYMRVLRDAGPPEGMCGIARVASYPIV